MSDADIDAHIIRDVIKAPEGEEMRWTNQHPAFEFRLETADGWEFYMYFRLPRETMRDTGPVTLMIRIDDHVLDRRRYVTPDEHEYAQPVPSSMLTTQRPVIVAVDVDPPWIRPADREIYGILLHSIGFRKRAR